MRSCWASVYIFPGRQKSVTDFWLAGRELGPITIGFSAASSWITASALLLATGLFLLIGVGSIWIWVFPNIAGLIIIAAISGRIKNIPALTQPELMEIRYDPMIRAPVALAVTIMMILFSVTDFIGFKLVLGTFFGIDPFYAVALMAVSVALYVSVGGFRAVVWTDILQYLLLAGLAIYVAALALDLSAGKGVTLLVAASALGTDWWDPLLLGGLMGALVFLVALLPGWVAEQDPWQKIWAARDESSARRGLLLGSALLALVYLCCFLTAIGLSVLYPRPTGEVEAEMLYLKLISDNVPGWLLALLTIGFAAASMSCTDTFATSAASCISRDLIQRHLRPAATMKEMLVINRILVIIMIAIAAAIALYANSIVDAVIIATVIGTTSYFFPIIGGLYWKRATRWGAMAALIVRRRNADPSHLLRAILAETAAGQHLALSDRAWSAGRPDLKRPILCRRLIGHKAGAGHSLSSLLSRHRREGLLSRSTPSRQKERALHGDRLTHRREDRG